MMPPKPSRHWSLRGAASLLIAAPLFACADQDADPETDAATAADTELGDTANDAGGDTQSNDTANDTTSDAGGDTAPEDTVDISAWPMPPDTSAIGDERPAQVIVPSNYTNEREWPLVVLLHGYSANGAVQRLYLGLDEVAQELGFIMIAPDGIKNAQGDRFWNAWPDCCGVGDDVDDVAYLISLLDAAELRYRIDLSRVYFIGHSNGGFMSYRMACEHSDRVTGIMSLAGAMPYAMGPCEPDHEVAVLQVHGRDDDSIPYEHQPDTPRGMGALMSVAFWADLQGCDDEPIDGEPLDLFPPLDEVDTTVTEWENCRTPAALWTLEGQGHLPPPSHALTSGFMSWLLEKGVREP